MVLTAYTLVLLLVCTGMAVRVVIPPCDQHEFTRNVDTCLSDFNHSLVISGLRDGCAWPAAKCIYNQLKKCVDDLANRSKCRGRSSLVDEVFLEVHKVYFSDCGWVHDPPLTTLILLIAPATIVTLFLPLLCVNLTVQDPSL